MGMTDIRACILFEDNEMMVLRKPSGTPVQSAGIGTMDLESGIRNYLAEKTPGKMPYVGIIHRLDQPVEGVLVFAKNPSAAKELSRQMTAGELGKYYYAVTDQKPLKEQAVLEDILLKDGRNNISKVVNKGTPGSKAARLSYELIEEAEDARTRTGKKYLLKIKLDTGRHHQIRVQMSHAGMALLGDKKYNAEEKSGYPLALCSYCLELMHPKKKKKMVFEIRPEGQAFQGFFM
ncbi:MAG: RluA family pseudouridine synthase [Clostridiales bacterium]|nr:RluA family pseudouridine synthase [Candidatus Blautia equi]